MTTTHSFDPDDADAYASRAAGNSQRFRQFLSDVSDLVALAKEAAGGSFRVAPGEAVILAATLLYVVSPVDAVPDAIPVAGLTDDAAIVATAIAALAPLVARFRKRQQ